MLHFVRPLVAPLALVVCAASCARAEDAYFDIPLSELKITSGELPRLDRGSEILRNAVIRNSSRWPRVVVDDFAEAYLRGGQLEFQVEGIVARAPEGKDLRGTISITNDDGTGMQKVKFTIPASAANPEARNVFHRTKQTHYERLQSLNLPGGAWFRHQANEARQAQKADDRSVVETAPRPNRQFQNEYEIERTFALFSGGRAISENLQLDRELFQRGNDDTLVDIDTLSGITVAEIDWKEKVKDLDPQLDSLAKLIPSDQHVLFVPSVTAAMKLVEQLDGNETVLLRLAEARIENAGTFGRYERQLGLSLADLPTELIATLALTGSDPYYRTGTDVAVLLETKQPAELAKLLIKKIQQAASGFPDAVSKTAKTSGVEYHKFLAPDRQLSAYVAELPGAVVVTNSLAQLERLASVQSGEAAISSLDEYKFFRHRYPLTDEEETGFVFLSDPTIRRWCSPLWRIATGRRTRNAAVLAELQARNAEAIASGKVEEKKLTTDLPLINPGEITLTDDGVFSTGQGSLAWMTPIVETPIRQVTKTEANAYNAWRDGYQRNWTGVFDPIGLRLNIVDDKLAGDLTIMPLIARSEYREIISISQGGSIAPDAGDPHATLAHAIVAINLDSPGMVRWSGLASMFVPTLREVGPFSWLGSSVSFYVDDDPLWKELLAMTPEERNAFSRRSLPRFPIALHADVSSSLKLAGFLAGLRTFIEQSGPGLTVWESLTYRDQPYVRVRGTDEAQLGELEEAAIYYTASSQGLTVSPNEAVIKRAIDRRLARKEAAKAETAENTAAETIVASLPWLGNNFCLQVDRRALELAVSAQNEQMQRVMQNLAWSNLPILNEWKRMFPDQDPIEVHETLWAARPICPGGGEYVWNADWQTMESTVYGHPGEPRNGPTFPETLKQFEKGNFGVTFEDQGLRARVELLREVP